MIFPLVEAQQVELPGLPSKTMLLIMVYPGKTSKGFIQLFVH
jgi:hypothetical protein